jgi:hypothetical protein
MADSRQSTATLTMTRGPGAGRRFDIGAAAVTIGRDAQCDVLVEGTWVSRQHARIAWTGTDYIVEDLGSTNGTFVNGERVGGPRALKSGDFLQLGEQIELAFKVRVSAPAHEEPALPGMAPSPRSSAGPPQPYAPPSQPVPVQEESIPHRKSARVWALALLGLLLILIIGAGAYYLLSDDEQQLADLPIVQAILPEPTSTPTPIPPTRTPTPVPGGTITGRVYLMDRDEPVRTTVLLMQQEGEQFKDSDSTTSDEDGYYSFLVEEPGTFRVEISVMDLLDTCDNLRTESGGWGATRVYDGTGLTDVRASSLAMSITLDDITTLNCELYCD